MAPDIWLLLYNRSFGVSENVARSDGSNSFLTFSTAWEKLAFHAFPAHSDLICKMMRREEEREDVNCLCYRMSFISTALLCCNLGPPSCLFSINMTICNKLEQSLTLIVNILPLYLQICSLIHLIGDFPHGKWCPVLCRTLIFNPSFGATVLR